MYDTMKPPAAIYSTRSTSRGLLLGLLAFLALGVQARAQETPEAVLQRIDTTRGALEKLVETRKLIAKEKKAWVEDEEALTGSIDVVKAQIASLREKIAAAEKSKSDVDVKKADLEQKTKSLKEASASLAQIIDRLEARTKLLLERLPDPILENVRPLSQDLPEDPKETKLSLGRRYQNVVGILNRINKFNREVSLRPEVRDLGDGKRAEVSAIYIGIGQGYYVTKKGDAAGIGSATAKGWVWKPANYAAAQIKKMVQILENEITAEFVPIPITIKDGGN